MNFAHMETALVAFGDLEYKDLKNLVKVGMVERVIINDDSTLTIQRIVDGISKEFTFKDWVIKPNEELKSIVIVVNDPAIFPNHDPAFITSLVAHP
jgi:hypothetical protein